MQKRPSSPFQIHVSPELARPWLPDSTADDYKISPFANKVWDVVMGNAARTVEKDHDGAELVWMVIQDPNKFTLDDIRTLLSMADEYGLRAYVWHWPAFELTSESSHEDALLMGDQFLVPLVQGDGDPWEGRRIVEHADAGNVVLSRQDAEAMRLGLTNGNV